jgi:DNA-binding NarL/FixJ family response regulator
MDSSEGRRDKPTRRSLSINGGLETARPEEGTTGTGRLTFLSALLPTAPESEFGLKESMQLPARTRLAYGLLRATIDEASQFIQANDAHFAGESRRLQVCAIESIHAGALATIEFMDAVSADAPTALAPQVVQSRRQRQVLNGQIMDYLAAARNMISTLTAPLSGPMVDCSKAGACQHAPCETQNVVERLKSLTERQKRVLELVADGLPNKIIAYELGLCETTVKAHVSEILRKLCVYSRARAIVLLANIDIAEIASASPDAKSGG